MNRKEWNGEFFKGRNENTQINVQVKSMTTPFKITIYYFVNYKKCIT